GICFNEQSIPLRSVRVTRTAIHPLSLHDALPISFELLIIDGLLVLTAVADNRTRMEAQRLLTTLLTQGAGLGFCVMACVQDPTTEGVPMRRFFPTKIALRLDQANHVDMVLGDGKRLLGALADQIPADQHGVGYVAIDGVREPRRFRF